MSLLQRRSDCGLPAVATCLGLFFVGLIGACSWSQYPDRREAVASPFDLTDADRDSSRRTKKGLFLMPDGLWAYLAESPPDLQPGTLAVAAPREAIGGGKHLFVVVERARWGLRLQRLDTRPVAARGTRRYQLRPVGPVERLDEMLKLAVETCLVRDAPQDADCLRDARPGTRWTLYPTDGAGRLRIDRSSGAMPVPRVGIVERHSTGAEPTRVGPERSTGPRLAIAAPRPVRPLPDVTVAADPSCNLDESTAETFDLHIVERNVPSVAHPLRVTDAAYRFGADALLDCESDRVSLALPTLFRSVLATPRGTNLGPSVLGARPVTMREGKTAARTLSVAALAHLAAGDPTMADLATERAIRRGARGEDGRLLLGAMEVAAAAGRPEAAYRRGQRASRGDWNRDNNPLYLLGRAAADAAIGKTREYYSTRDSARKTAGRVDRHRLVTWLEWTGRLRKAMSGELSAADLQRKAGDITGQDATLWRAATRLVATRQDVPMAPVELGAATARKLDLRALPAGLRGDDLAAPCPDGGDCPLDVYGRRLAATLTSSETTDDRLIRRTMRMGRSVFQPGLAVAIDADVSGRLALLTALAPHLDYRAEGSVVTTFDERLRGGIVDAIRADDECGPVASTAVRERIGLERRLTNHAHPRIRVLDWLLNGDGRRMCAEPAVAARSLVTVAADSPEMRDFLAPLFPALVERAQAADTRRTVVTHAADFAAKHGLSGSCKRWRLALAAASARTGDHRTADTHLEAAVNCGAHEEYDRAESILIAFVAFMRSGSLPRRIDGDLRSDLQRLVRHRVDAVCVGLADFGYDLSAALPDEIDELARTLEKRSAQTQDDDNMLTIRSTRDNLADAADALDAAKRALSDGDFDTARNELETADTTFSRLAHSPGLAQARFLSDVLMPEASTTSDSSSTSNASGDSKPSSERTADTSPEDSDGSPGVATSCELNPESIPGSAEARRCLLAEHGAAKLADAWGGRADTLASTDRSAFLAALFLLDGRHDLLRALAGQHDLAVCRHP